MAESYFELLTEQSGIPAKPFDSLAELKRLRQRLALRMQVPEPPKIEIHVVTPPPIAQIPDPATLETVVKTVRNIKKTLNVRQRSRTRRRLLHPDIFLEKLRRDNQRQIPAVVTQYLTDLQGGALEIMSAALTASGIIGIVFSALSFSRGWENDLSLGTLVSVSGLAVIAIGLCGRFLAARTALL